MPRKVAEACIFCGSSPCSCNAATPKQSPKPRSAGKGTPPQAPADRTSSDPFGEFVPPDKGSKFKNVAAPRQRKRTAEEIEEHTAIRNLAPLLCDQDRKRFASIISPSLPSHLERRVIEWRERNGRVLPPHA